MRIISGRHRRRRFEVPKSFNARPTTDFAKENLFNVLVQYLDFESLHALDLFAGTGSISAELVSRGAERVLSVELRREHSDFIRSVCRQLGEEAVWQIVGGDVFRYLRSSSRGADFDFIFADPPYQLAELETLPDVILSSGLLRSDGLLVVEHPKAYDFSGHQHFVAHRAYGSVNFSFFAPHTL